MASPSASSYDGVGLSDRTMMGRLPFAYLSVRINILSLHLIHIMYIWHSRIEYAFMGFLIVECWDRNACLCTPQCIKDLIPSNPTSSHLTDIM